MRADYKSILCIAVLLLSLVFAPASYAAGLNSFSPTPATLNGVVTGGMPAWYQDQNGVSVSPCFNVPACGLIGLGDPNFNEALPLSYPTNFPSEAFYFNATTIFPVGTASALVVMALEYTFVNPTTGALTTPATPGALAAPFQRQRLVETFVGGGGVLPVTAGNFTLTTPWGVTTFAVADAKCVNQGGNTKCTMTQDLPAPGIPVSFAAALGQAVPGSISTFLKDPAAPAGFLGNAAAAASFTGGVTGNSISVTDPLGQTGSTTTLTLLVGELVGMTATPSSITFPAQKPVITSPTVTVTIANPSTVSPATIGAATKTGANAADFTLVPGAPIDCSVGAIIPAGGTCTFGVTFSELAPGVNGTKSALISFPVVTPLSLPPVIVNLAGAIDSIPPTITLTAPLNNDTSWPANNRPHVTFSEPVTGVSGTTFTLIGPAGDVGGTVTLDATGKLADYAQPANLQTGATYTATLTTAITDIAGNPLALSTFSFKAGAADTTPPSVSATTPSNNATDVKVNSPITATFAGTVDPNTVNATTFTLSEGVTGSVTFDQVTRTAIFKPAASLAFFRSYTATIAGVKSLGQVSMTAPFTWTFFTNGAPNPPQLYSPAHGSTVPGTTVDLQWIKAKDEDGETVTYHVWYCTNPAMVGCTPVDAPASPSLRDTLAGLGGYGAGMLLAGIAIAGGVRSRRKLFFFIAVLLISGMAITACGKKSSDSGIDPATISTQHVTGLRAGSTYYWKVVADDGNGAQVPSETRSFSMQ
jgi:hypothetical protein